MSSTPVTRGFLFADLRGYTAFVERHGNAAAGALLERFREIVRAELADLDGAEVRTEGDSFYIVFPSASLAVRGGLAIRDAVARENGANGDRRIDVGIGINAGETHETQGGPVGSAVNVAARVGAKAQAGEVLVTDTVRHIVQGNADVQFRAAGRYRLKGVSEPVAVYSAWAGQAAIPRKAVSFGRRAVIAAGGASLGALALVVVALALNRPPAPAPSPAATVSPTPSAPGALSLPTADPSDPERAIMLSPARYALDVFRPRLELTTPDGRWSMLAETTDVFELAQLEVPGVADTANVYIDGEQVQVVFDPPCPVGETKLLEERPRALIEALQANEFVTVSDPRPVSFAGFTGLQVDVTYAKPLGEACAPYPEGVNQAQLHLWPVGGSTFKLDPGDRVRLISVDVAGRPLTIIVGTYDRENYSLFEDIAQPIVESISVAP